MRVIAKKHLSAYWNKHPDAEQPLKSWHDEAIKATWKTPQDIKAQYASASILAGNRVVFNIKSNRHRLIVSVAYQFGALYVTFIGTHAECDKVDVTTVDQE